MLDKDIANALARLDRSFRALNDTRSELSHALDEATTKLLRSFDWIEGDRSTRQATGNRR